MCHSLSDWRGLGRPREGGPNNSYFSKPRKGPRTRKLPWNIKGGGDSTANMVRKLFQGPAKGGKRNILRHASSMCREREVQEGRRQHIKCSII